MINSDCHCLFCENERACYQDDPCSREFKLQGVPVVCTAGVRHLYTVGLREVEGNSTNTSVLKTYLFRALH